MSWISFGLKIAEFGANALFGEDSISAEELKEALNDAVEAISLKIDEAFEEEKREEIVEDIDLLTREINFYKTSSDEARYNLMYDTATRLLSKCKSLDMINPQEKGLAGHPFFMVAASIYISLLEEREKWTGNSEKENIIALMEDNNGIINYANRMHQKWQNWNNNCYGPIYISEDKKFAYEYRGKEINTPYKWLIFPSPSATSMINENKKNLKEATNYRLGQISLSWGKWFDLYVEPSLQIIDKWEGYLKKLTGKPSKMQIIMKYLSEGTSSFNKKPAHLPPLPK